MLQDVIDLSVLLVVLLGTRLAEQRCSGAPSISTMPFVFRVLFAVLLVFFMPSFFFVPVVHFAPVAFGLAAGPFLRTRLVRVGVPFRASLRERPRSASDPPVFGL